jgi:hypothetical protein
MPFVWSEGQQRYRDAATGRYVAQRTINGAVDQVINSASQRLTDLTQQLQAGAITLATWQLAMVAELKPLHLGAAAIGRGGWTQMTPSDWGWTGSVLRRQYGFLRAFAHDIATGHQPLDGRLLVRVRLYAQSARATQREMMRRTAMLIGKTEERNVLGAADRHCRACKDCTSYGWVPIGTLLPIGSRTCLSNCRCMIEFRVTPQLARLAA